jgi:transcriptional regulator with XRE-family HTH domain
MTAEQCTFGALIRRHRIARGLRVATVARAAKLEHSHLYRIETGSRPPPEIYPFIPLLAEALSVATNSREYRELLAVAVEERFRGRFDFKLFVKK